MSEGEGRMREVVDGIRVRNEEEGEMREREE